MRESRIIRPTPRPARANRTAGFTLLELLVVLAILGALAAILVPIIGRARAASRSVACLANLRQISVAFHVFAEHNNGLLPDPAVTQVSWEGSLKRYLNRKTFACPSDDELYPAVGSSYDWRDTGDPLTTLAGKPVSLASRDGLILVFDALPGWHGTAQVNVAYLDGSARPCPQSEYFRDLATPLSAAIGTRPGAANR